MGKKKSSISSGIMEVGSIIIIKVDYISEDGTKIKAGLYKMCMTTQHSSLNSNSTVTWNKRCGVTRDVHDNATFRFRCNPSVVKLYIGLMF